MLIQDNLDQQLESTAVAQHTRKTPDDRPGLFDKERAGHLRWRLESQTMAEKRGSGEEPQTRRCAMSERVLGLSGKGGPDECFRSKTEPELLHESLREPRSVRIRN